MAKKSFLTQIKKSIDIAPDESHVKSESGSERTLVQITKRLSNARIIKLDLIKPDPDQPRKKIDGKTLEELALSIKKHGLLQPITVQNLDDGYFKIISGERRFRASQMAGLDEIPALILTPEDDADRMAKQLVENMVREDLSPIEKAYSILQYKEMLGKSAKWADVERSLSISETRRKQFIRLLNLPDEIQARILAHGKQSKSGLLTEKHARALLLLNRDPEEQEKMFNKMIDPSKELTAESAIKRAQEIVRKNEKNNITKIYSITFKYRTTEELIRKLKNKIVELGEISEE